MAQRYIKRNHGSECPIHVMAAFASWNTRLIADNPAIRIDTMAHICAHYSRYVRGNWTEPESLSTNDHKAFWEFVASHTGRKQRLWLFLYGAQQQAELLGVYEQIERCAIRWQSAPDLSAEVGNKPSFGYFCSESHPWILKCLFRLKSLIVVDILNYVQKPLIAFDVHGELHNDGADGLDWAMYDSTTRAHFSSRIIYNWITGAVSFWRKRDLGTWQPTAAKLAESSFKHYLTRIERDYESEQQEPVEISPGKLPFTEITLHDNKQAKALERRSYFGGKAEAYYVGTYTGKVYYVDVRALYPYIASCTPMPCKLNTHTGLASLETLGQSLLRYCCIADVEIACHDSQFPLRVDGENPVRLVHPGELGEWYYGPAVIYPEGSYRTVLAGMELRRAYYNGHIRRVHAISTYVTGSPFTRFFSGWWAVRCEHERNDSTSNAVNAQLAKIVMNGLIGKFGQRSQRWVDSPHLIPPEPWKEYFWGDATTGEMRRYRAIGWNSQLFTGSEELEFSNVAIPSVVAANAREYMRDILRSLPERSVLLMDTDGVIVTQRGMDAIKQLPLYDEYGMGYVRIKDEADEIEILGPRHYRFGQRWVLAGVEKGWEWSTQGTRVQWLSDWRFSRIFNLTPGTFAAKLEPWKKDRRYHGRYIHKSGWTYPLLVGLD